MKLIKTQTKSGKYNYSIVDDNGNILATRTSSKEYVAATITGKYFFGRLDLIGKGEHGERWNNYEKKINQLSELPANEKSDKYSDMTTEQIIEDLKISLSKLTTIAYL